MKFALALLALVAAASAKIEIPNFGRGELHKDIQEFLDMLPQEEIFAITLEYFSEDKEFQAMVEYLLSDEFRDLVKEVEALPEIKVLMDYIHEAGIDIYTIVNLLNEMIGLDPLTPPSSFFAVRKQITGGIRGYVDDIMAILPLEELNDLYEKKLKESKAFADFIAQIESENFQEIVNKVYANPKTQELLKHAEAAGIDLELIKELLKVLWGIKIPPRPRFYIRH
ncbi:protein G12 [Linepithema humile]|uniref:protein G12 n=1 Tax=Linepithema humile TaxID=83485 RepID=UPI0006236887|nr:PREDICTED: protein G12 [Linepithema humile]